MPDDRPEMTDRTLMPVPLHMAEAVSAVLCGEAVAVPRELDEVAAWSMREAFRSSRRGGISGMSLDAQFKVVFAPEIAAYRALLAASPYAQETPDGE